MGIRNALLQLELDESRSVAVGHAERWRDALEEMREVASAHELEALHRIAWQVEEYLSSHHEKLEDGIKDGWVVYAREFMLFVSAFHEGEMQKVTWSSDLNDAVVFTSRESALAAVHSVWGDRSAWYTLGISIVQTTGPVDKAA